jgi:hypothetical protein
MDGASSTYGREESAYKILVGKPEGKRPLGIPMARLEDDIEMDKGVEWIYLAWDPTETVTRKCRVD